MSKVFSTSPVASVNGWAGFRDVSIVVEHETMTIVTSGTVKPDPDWAHTDRFGHFHAASTNKNEPYPTLRSRVIPCGHPDHDEECGGLAYVCKICDEEITPAFLADEHSGYREIPGLASWRIELKTDERRDFMSVGQEVSVRVSWGSGTEYFGIGVINEIGVDPVGAFQMIILGVGPLGQRAQ